MATEELRSKLVGLKEETWQLARESLEEGESQIYRALGAFIETLSGLIATRGTNAGLSNGLAQVPSAPELIPIFARYKGQKYDAQWDRSRINGGRGHCVLFRGQWVTPSAAATSISRTPVNGWRFWKYSRSNNTSGIIDELRGR